MDAVGGLLNANVRREQSEVNSVQSKEDVGQPPQSPRPGLRIDTQASPSTLVGSPTLVNARPSPVSPSGGRAKLESAVSIVAVRPSPERQISVRFAEAEEPAPAAQGNKSSTSPPSGTRLSPIDEKWGELFDNRGRATERLDQVLRGLANYIVSPSS